LDVLKWVIDKYPLCGHVASIAEEAAKHGQLHILEWLDQCNAPFGMTLSIAAANGHVHILEWALRAGSEMTSFVYKNAAFSGQLRVLQWLKANVSGVVVSQSDVCGNAAWQGHLEVLQWAVANGFPFSRLTCRFVATNHPAVLQWLENMNQ
jgi:hypothetical protein